MVRAKTSRQTLSGYATAVVVAKNKSILMEARFEELTHRRRSKSKVTISSTARHRHRRLLLHLRPRQHGADPIRISKRREDEDITTTTTPTLRSAGALTCCQQRALSRALAAHGKMFVGFIAAIFRHIRKRQTRRRKRHRVLYPPR